MNVNIIYRIALFVLVQMVVTGCWLKKESEQKQTDPLSKETLAEIQDSLFDALQNKIPEWLQSYDVPSVSATAIENGEIVWSGTFGRQDSVTPANENTLYLSASIAKPLTTEVFLRLATQGKVSLDESMAKYWLDPDIEDDPMAKSLTARHVLTHQTGFKNWRRMTNGRLRFERPPGEEVGYSGEGFFYLVRFVEKKLGKPFNVIAGETLFGPTGLTNSSLVHQDWFEGRLAQPYIEKGEWRNTFKVENAFGAGGLRTTSADYAKFLLAIMNNEGVSESLRREQFQISKNQYKKCIESVPREGVCPQKLGFGLGWYVYDFKDEQIIGHTGANSGERTLAVFSPDKKSGLVVMTNGANGNYVIFAIAEYLNIHSDFISIEGPKKAYGIKD